VRVRGLRVDAGAADGGRPGGGAGSGAPLVDGLGFEVAPGAALGIVGESGSGKSLTLRALLGMMPVGTRVVDGAIAVGGSVGMVFQDPLTALDPLTRVGVQLREAVEAGGAAGSGSRGRASARVRELLEQVELPDPERIARSYPHQLSGGQRQRVVIAMALAGDPAVLLCDEPTTALDVTVQRQVLRLLDGLRRKRGLTLVFVSHDLAVVASMCDRVLVMREGREVESGRTQQVIRDPRDAYTRSLLEAVPRLPDPAPDPDSAPDSASASAAAPSAPSVREMLDRGGPAGQ
jgi:ABC-type glutathione transport system ATPase component